MKIGAFAFAEFLYIFTTVGFQSSEISFYWKRNKEKLNHNNFTIYSIDKCAFSYDTEYRKSANRNSDCDNDYSKRNLTKKEIIHFLLDHLNNRKFEIVISPIIKPKGD